MDIIINVLIYAGAALMVYNVIRYGMFVKQSRDLEQKNRKIGMLIVPLLLLVFFLVGYIVVGISGIADILIALILFGGSVFVFLLLAVLLSIVYRIRETDKVLSTRYEEMRAQLGALTQDANSAYLVNLTRDEIVQRVGGDPDGDDYGHDSYSGLIAARGKDVFDPAADGEKMRLFQKDELLRLYGEGHTGVSGVYLIKNGDGIPEYVQIEATLTKMPVSGDVVAMISERKFNDKIVRQTLLEQVMMDRYDRIGYFVEGVYRELFSNDGKKEGLLLPPDPGDTYESIYLNHILPTMVWDKNRGPNPLRLSLIDKALEKNDVYNVNEPFVLDGVTRYKRIDFYCVERKAKFYVMLISDTTQLMSGRTEKPAEPEKTAEPDNPKTEPEKPAEPEPPVPEKEEEKKEESAPAGKPLHILLVDDNEINREIAGMMLEADGWTVEQATNGSEAVEKVTSAEPGTFDLVLMDVQMPVMNGYEATEAIRALSDPAKSSVPIIAVTANAFAEDVAAAKAAGMDAHVTKPVEPDAIKKAIAEVTKK